MSKEVFGERNLRLDICVWTFFFVGAYMQEKTPPFSLVDELRQLSNFIERFTTNVRGESNAWW